VDGMMARIEEMEKVVAEAETKANSRISANPNSNKQIEEKELSL